MSVVNKMLNDLENREQDSGVSADYQPPEKRKFSIVWLLVLLLLIAGGVWGYLQYGSTLIAKNSETTGDSAVASTGVGESEVSSQLSSTIDRTPASAVIDAASTVDSSTLADLAKIAEQDSLETPVNVAATNQGSADNGVQLMEDKGQSESNAQTNNVTKEAIVNNTSIIQPTKVNSEEVVKQQETSSLGVDKLSADKMDEQTILGAQPKDERTTMAIKPSSDLGTTESLRLSAQKALADKDTERAITLLSRLLNEQSDNVNARKQLASLLFASREFGKAETLLKSGIQNNPQQHDVRLMLSRLYQQNDRNEDALALLLEVSPDVALNIEYYSQRASLAQRLNLFEQASQDYQILVNLEPEQAKWWLGVGVSADKLNQRETAILAYTRALSLKQLDTPVTAFMQQRLRGLGR
jgi:MSHA biogenesis protein MshN